MLPMPPVGPRAERGAPRHMAKEKHGRDQNKVQEPSAPQAALSPALRGFYSACTACLGLAASLCLFWAAVVSALRSGVVPGIQTCICRGGSTVNSQHTCSYDGDKSPGCTKWSCINQKSRFS